MGRNRHNSWQTYWYEYRQPIRAWLVSGLAVVVLFFCLPIGKVAISQQATFTPTPLPITIIRHPGPGDAVAGYTTITGSTLTRNCLKYSLDISSAGRESWENLTVQYRCVSNGDLYTFDTKEYADGYYDLRLRAIRNDGNYDEAFLRGLEIRNSFPPTPTPQYDQSGSPLPTPTSTPLPIPTPTQQSKIIHRIPGGQGFYSPEIGETVRGYVDIVGTVYGFPGREFKRYDLFISPNGQQQWTWLYSSGEQYWQSTLYVLNTTAFPNGYYDLLLRNVYADSNYDDFVLRYVRIDNSSAVANQKQTPPIVQSPGITSPQSGSTVQGITEVRGRAVDPQFLRWELYWSVSGAEQWTFVTSSSKQEANGLLVKLDFSNLGGLTIDLRMRLVRTDYNYDEYMVRRIAVLPVPTAVPTATVRSTP